MSAKGWKPIAFVISALIIAAPTASAQTVKPQETADKSTKGEQINQKLDTAQKDQQSLRDELRNQEADIDALKLKNTKEGTLDSARALKEAEDARDATANKLAKLAYRIDALRAGNNYEFTDSDMKIQLQYGFKNSFPSGGATSGDANPKPAEANKQREEFAAAYAKLQDMKAAGKATAQELDAQSTKVKELGAAWIKADTEAVRSAVQNSNVETKVEIPNLPPADVLKKTGEVPTEKSVDELITPPRKILDRLKAEKTEKGRPPQMPNTQSMALPSTPSTFSNTSTMGTTKGGVGKMKGTKVTAINTVVGTPVVSGLGATTRKGTKVTNAKTGLGSSSKSGTTMSTTVGKPIIRIGGGGLGF